MAARNRRLWAGLATSVVVLAGAVGCSASSASDQALSFAGGFSLGGQTSTATGGSAATTLGPGNFAGNVAASGGASSGIAPPSGIRTDDGAVCVGCDSAAGASGNGDQFEPVGSNPFVYTAHDPLSTFGADVDSASYDIFRQYVRNGSIPAAASVRLEEYVNYFEYDYPAPAHDADEPFAIHLSAAHNLVDDGTALLRVGIQGKLAPPEEKRPANLVFLVDVSGSMMDPVKLPLVKEVLKQTIGVLDPTDTISIVTYAGSTAVRLAPTPAAESTTIVAVIDSLDAAGSTAGGAGINLAYEQAEAGRIEGGINHVVLCTDGDFNVGLSSTADLLALIRSKRDTGVTLTTLGFGTGNLNDAMMEAVSDAGNGIYSFIGNAAQAADYAEHKILSTMVHIAKDMKLQIEFNPAEVLAYRLLGYENRAIADNDFRNDVVDAGEVGSGHRVTALYQLVLVGGRVPEREGAPAAEDGAVYDGEREVSASDLVEVKVRYKAPTATDADPAAEVAVSLPASTDLTQEMDQDFAWAAAVASFAELLKQSPYADSSVLPAIDTIVSSAATGHADRVEFAELYASAKTRLPAR